ncbi:MAG: bifunctional riboflavin kinase/FAD synthetase [Stagnimonas sp.]|nr:bifunctional riboflavin kinase/FAD synthetase [Stagnimonas sp.]
MQLIRGLHNLRDASRGCVLSIGNYDGVHLGHQALLAQLRQHSADTGLPATVLTFEPTPREYFAPAQAPRRVLTLRDKLAALAAQGVQRVVIARFDARLAACSAENFITDVIARDLGAKVLVIGDDFRFGAGRRGDFALLQQQAASAGYRLVQAPTLITDAVRCSSTALRAALAKAELEVARRLLGRRFRISGRVCHGKKLARELGMPTANLPMRRLPPLPFGVYAVHASVPGMFDGCAGVASLGVRPAVGTTPCLLEVHLFADNPDLYGREMCVDFLRFEREEQNFASLDALKSQMRLDADRVKTYFANTNRGI